MWVNDKKQSSMHWPRGGHHCCGGLDNEKKDIRAQVWGPKVGINMWSAWTIEMCSLKDEIVMVVGRFDAKRGRIVTLGNHPDGTIDGPGL